MRSEGDGAEEEKKEAEMRSEEIGQRRSSDEVREMGENQLQVF